MESDTARQSAGQEAWVDIRRILDAQRFAVLSTHDHGQPYASLVAFWALMRPRMNRTGPELLAGLRTRHRRRWTGVDLWPWYRAQGFRETAERLRAAIPRPPVIQRKKCLQMSGSAVESLGRPTAVAGERPSRESRLDPSSKVRWLG